MTNTTPPTNTDPTELEPGPWWETAEKSMAFYKSLTFAQQSAIAYAVWQERTMARRAAARIAAQMRARYLCTCTTTSEPHSITCALSAQNNPHAMVSPDGDLFYPDNPADAYEFAALYDAVPVDDAGFGRWMLKIFRSKGIHKESKPTPTERPAHHFIMACSGLTAENVAKSLNLPTGSWTYAINRASIRGESDQILIVINCRDGDQDRDTELISYAVRNGFEIRKGTCPRREHAPL